MGRRLIEKTTDVVRRRDVGDFWRAFGTRIEAIGTPWRKRAALRRLSDRRHAARNRRQCLSGTFTRDRREQPTRVWMRGRGEQAIDRRLFDDAAGVHDG